MGFQQGLSGLNAASRNLDVIGHNIANANTTGMKAGRAEFAEVMAASIGASRSGNIGIGVDVATVSQQFTQGNLTITNNDLDVGINGAGFFVLRREDGSRVYTRSGEFKLDAQGYIVSNDGSRVQGYPTDPDTAMPTSVTLQDLRMPTIAPIPGNQTTTITATNFNLDSTAPVWNSQIPNTPLATYGTAITLYDSQGNEIPQQLYFRKIAPNVWQVYTDATSDATANTSQVAILEFNTDGSLRETYIDDTLAANNPPTADLTIVSWGDLGNGAAPPLATEAFTLNGVTVAAGDDLDAAFGALPFTMVGVDLTTIENDVLGRTAYAVDPGTLDANGAVAGSGAAAAGALPQIEVVLPPTAGVTTIGLGGSGLISVDLANITQQNLRFSPGDLSQDGYPPGELVGLTIEESGVITARFSNGETQARGMIALANFRNVQGLSPTGSGQWVETYSSGAPTFAGPTVGNLGGLRAGALEESNVDLTKELVAMMAAQRTYQANAQTIKAQDQILTTIVNMR